MKYILEVVDDDNNVLLSVETRHIETIKEILIVKDGKAEKLFK